MNFANAVANAFVEVGVLDARSFPTTLL